MFSTTSENSKTGPAARSRHSTLKRNDCSPRDSAVEASRRRREEENGAAGSSAGSRGRAARGGASLFLGDGEPTRTPNSAAVRDAGLGGWTPPTPPAAALVAVATGAARDSSPSERAEAARREGGSASDLGATKAAAGGAAGGGEDLGETLVSARVAAVAATLAAADRGANCRFEADGSINRAEARPLTRREREGLKRRALAEKSLVASTSWVNKHPAAGRHMGAY